MLRGLPPGAGFQYNVAGRVIQQTLPDGRVITFAYDANGNLTSLTPPGRPVHGFDYTPVDLESIYAPPAAGLTTPNTVYSYNLDRQLDLITRPDGQTVDFVYDGAGRLSQQALPGGRTITYAYDPTTGHLASLSGPDGEALSLAYDGSLLLSETWSGPVAGEVSRTYDNDFRVASRSVNGGSAAAFGYDADSLLTTAGAMTLARDAQNGLLTGSTLGVVTDAYSYGGFGEVGGYQADVSDTPVYTVTYTRDDLGRIALKTEAVEGVTTTFEYGYDLAGRLIDVATNGTPTAHYDYDANGNRTGGFNQLCSSISNVGVDNQDRLLTADCGGSTARYTYTANGELFSKTVNSSQSTVYSYDALGNLLRVTLPSGDVVDYVVDGRNRRVGKKVNGVLTQGFLYDGELRIVAELDGNGNVVSRFVYGSKVNVPEYMVGGGVTYRIISDQLGSPRLVVNIADGTIVQRMDYDEFGNVLADTSPGFQPFGFAGGLYNRDTKLVRFGARDYDPETGRWTAKDPIRFQGGDPNLYGYVLGDPANLADPAGKTTYVCTYPAYSSSYNHQHAGLGVNTQASSGFYPTGSAWGSPGILAPDQGPGTCYPVNTTPLQEQQVQQCLNGLRSNPGQFNLATNNCAETAADCFRQAGIYVPPALTPQDLADWAQQSGPTLNDPSQPALPPYPPGPQ